MKIAVAFFMLLMVTVINGKDELKFSEFFIFQNNKISLKNRDGEYKSRYLDIKISEYAYNTKEDGNLKIYFPELKIKTKYLDVYGCVTGFDTNRIKLFGEDISIENQMLLYLKAEGKNRIGYNILNYGIGYGAGDVKLKSSIADGTFNNGKIINGNISLRRKKTEINYKTGIVKSNLLINENSNIGNIKLKYNYGDVRYGATSIWYLNLDINGEYDFDFLTVGTLALAEQNYLDMNGEFEIFGINRTDKIETGRFEIELFNSVGTLKRRNGLIEMKRIKKHIFSPSETEIRKYKIETENPIFYYGYGDIAYKLSDNIKFGIRKTIPYVKGIKLKKSNEKDGEEESGEGKSGISKSGKMNSRDYWISGTMCYLTIYY